MKTIILLLTLGLSWAQIMNPDLKDTYDCPFCQPEQIHIAFGEKINDIVVTWSTLNDTLESRVQFGVGVMDSEANGSSTPFQDWDDRKENGKKVKEWRLQYIHRVTLKDLKFDTKYVYHCGSEFGWSELFSFKTPPAGEEWVVRAAIYGDMGNTNAHSMSYLQDEAERGHFDLILHVGDFAYDMFNEAGRRGDQFMRQIQPLAAIVPYMTCPGNHEEHDNFTQYKNRFSMPGPFESMFYSFDMGPVHFVAISTEFYYFTNYGIKMVINQFEWLENDLKTANEKQNREKRPWIVLFGHRPMYCSNSNDPDCSLEYTRKGLPILGWYSLEPLLKTYGVDIVIWAHEHSYERLWPIYDERVYNGTEDQPYHNPGAPVHIVTGSAGCQEGVDPFKPSPPAWSAFRSNAYGYTRFEAHNKTHIHMEQVDVMQTGKVIDAFWIVKDSHGPFTYL